MKVLSWLVALPILVAVGFFVIANRETVTVSLWPLPEQVTLPLFAALAGALYIGFAFGAIIAWWSGHGARSAARAERRRAEALTRELAAVQAKLDARSLPASPPLGAALPPPPPEPKP
jgi:hypothetical protein